MAEHSEMSKEGKLDILRKLMGCINEGSLKDVQKCVKELSVSEKNDILKLKDERDSGKTVIHQAVLRKNLDVLKYLLLEGGDPATVDNFQQTPLHYACDLDDDAGIDMVNALLDVEVEGGSIDQEDSMGGDTPLHKASEKGNAETVEKLLRKGARSDIEDYRHGTHFRPIHLASMKGHTSVVMKFVERDKSAVNCMNSTSELTPLHCACEYGHVDLVYHLLDEKFEVNIDIRNSLRRSPLHEAAAKGYDQIVSLLLKKGKAEIDVEEEYEKRPIDLACEGGYLKVVSILLQRGAQVGKHTLKSAISSGSVDCAMAIVASKQWDKALKYTYKLSASSEETTPFRELIKAMPDVAEEVLNKCVSEPEGSDTTQRTCIFNYEFLEDFQQKSHKTSPMQQPKHNYTLDSDLDDLSSEYGDSELGPKVSSGTKRLDIGMIAPRKLGKRKREFAVPQVKQSDIEMTEIDESNMNEDDNGDEVNLISWQTEEQQHKCNEENWGPFQFKKSNHPLAIMVESEQLNLLKHPVVGSLLHYKWKKFGQLGYFFNLFTYIIFLAFLTAFALVVSHPLEQICSTSFNGTCEGNESTANSANTSCSCSLRKFNFYFLYTSGALVVGLSIIRLLMEAVQLMQLRLHYFLDWTNWIEITLYICSIIFVWVFHDDCLCPSKWQWQIGIIAVFLGWITLLIFIQKFPQTGIYVLMFLSILYTYLKAITLFFLLIIAFSLTFYMVFYEPQVERSPFSNTGIAIIKMLSMTSGDYDFDSFFHLSPSGDTDDQDDVPFLPVAIIFWILFIILMPILLINMLVGLAVDDIQGIQEAAALKKLALQVDLVLNVEELLLWRSKYVIRENEIVVDNLNWWEKFQYLVWGGERYETSEVIKKVKVRHNMNIMSSKGRIGISERRDDVSEIANLKKTLSRMQKLMKKMADKQNISDSEDEGTVSDSEDEGTTMINY